MPGGSGSGSLPPMKGSGMLGPGAGPEAGPEAEGSLPQPEMGVVVKDQEQLGTEDMGAPGVQGPGRMWSC
jgi:hypothetical protein